MLETFLIAQEPCAHTYYLLVWRLMDLCGDLKLLLAVRNGQDINIVWLIHRQLSSHTFFYLLPLSVER